MKHEFRPSPAQDASCEETTALLTALFDGEADADQAARARAHLLLCRRCAATWAQWHTTRRLLQTSTSVLPPPALLARILLACRLTERPQTSPNLDALQTQILAQTTGIAPRPRFRFAPISALAVPAIAAFLLVFHPTGTPILRDHDEMVGLSTPIAAHSTPRAARRQKSTAKSEFKDVSLPAEDWEIALNLAVADSKSASKSAPQRPTSQLITTHAISESSPPETAPLRAQFEPKIAPNRETQPSPGTTQLTLAALAVVPPKTLPPAVLASDVKPLRLRLAARPLPMPRRAGVSLLGLRASLPTAVLASFPRPTTPEIALNDEDNDDRPVDEMRSVVDAYRATLVSDDGDDATFNG